uniref:Uncharacterized protein n=1 Tax=Macaca fascicularis TaxID=9541 RepID=Q9GMR4_MACFA|nr:hypothetical protein [Macaca fascicularis]
MVPSNGLCCLSCGECRRGTCSGGTGWVELDDQILEFGKPGIVTVSEAGECAGPQMEEMPSLETGWGKETSEAQLSVIRWRKRNPSSGRQ